MCVCIYIYIYIYIYTLCVLIQVPRQRPLDVALKLPLSLRRGGLAPLKCVCCSEYVLFRENTLCALVVAPPSSVVMCLREVLVWGLGVLLLSCVCVGVGGVVLCRCVFVRVTCFSSYTGTAVGCVFVCVTCFSSYTGTAATTARCCCPTAFFAAAPRPCLSYFS